MRRSLVALAAALALGAGAAGIAGAFSSGGSKPSHAAAAATGSQMPMPMPMPMPTTPTGATAKAVVELHRTVVDVKISNFAFQPARIVVSPGTKVVWTNEDSDPHTVTTDKPGFSSQALDTGSHYTEVMQKTGNYTYHCTIHPFMHGAVVVQG